MTLVVNIMMRLLKIKKCFCSYIRSLCKVTEYKNKSTLQTRKSNAPKDEDTKSKKFLHSIMKARGSTWPYIAHLITRRVSSQMAFRFKRRSLI